MVQSDYNKITAIGVYKIIKGDNFFKNIIFSDEAQFHLDDFVNNQIVGFESVKILALFMKNRCTHKEPLFGADYGL